MKHQSHPLTPSVFAEGKDAVRFTQVDYPAALYESELAQHKMALEQYEEIHHHMSRAQEAARPNLDLYKQQPYLTFLIRLKLIDFLVKMAIRLKILPFVLHKAVRIFDRYCSKRIVLLDQLQLIITTCLWLAAKIQGGNNHFVNLNNLDKVESVRTINDLGYGLGGKYLGPTERFRLPKLHELVKLCGAKCKYDQGMFKQMELHVLTTLEWSLNDPLIEEFLLRSEEFLIVPHDSRAAAIMEMCKVKEYLSYSALYLSELVDVSLPQLSQVIVDLINELFGFEEGSAHYQKHVYDDGKPVRIDPATYSSIKKHLVRAVLNSSDFMLKLFCTSGPQHVYRQTVANNKNEWVHATSHGNSFGNVHTSSHGNVHGTPHGNTHGNPHVTPHGNMSNQSPKYLDNVSTQNLMTLIKQSPLHFYQQPFTSTRAKSIGDNYLLLSLLSLPYAKTYTPKAFSRPFLPKGKSPYKASPKRWLGSSPRKLPQINTNIVAPPKKAGLYLQSSLNLSVSLRSQDEGGAGDIFELDYRKVGTPLSENELPIYMKREGGYAVV